VREARGGVSRGAQPASRWRHGAVERGERENNRALDVWAAAAGAKAPLSWNCLLLRPQVKQRVRSVGAPAAQLAPAQDLAWRCQKPLAGGRGGGRGAELATCGRDWDLLYAEVLPDCNNAAGPARFQ